MPKSRLKLRICWFKNSAQVSLSAWTPPFSSPLQPLLLSYHDDGGQQHCARGHHEEAVDEPRAPNDTIADPHGFEGFFEAEFLFQHDALHCHGYGVDPGQDHEYREAAVQCDHKAGEGVEDERKTVSWDCTDSVVSQHKYTAYINPNLSQTEE